MLDGTVEQPLTACQYRRSAQLCQSTFHGDLAIVTIVTTFFKAAVLMHKPWAWSSEEYECRQTSLLRHPCAAQLACVLQILQLLGYVT